MCPAYLARSEDCSRTYSNGNIAGNERHGIDGLLDSSGKFNREWNDGPGEVDYFLTQVLTGYGYFRSTATNNCNCN